MSSELGVVVVGMGIVGGVRVKDIKRLTTEEQYKDTEYGRLRIRGYVSRRQHDIEGVPSVTLEQALERDDVQIVIVTTENSAHFETARRALLAKKHVLIEYPMCETLEQGKELMRLAEENGVTVYEEDLSLLTIAYKDTKKKLQESAPVKNASMKLISSAVTGWKSDQTKAGSPFVSQISLLHNLLMLCGDMKPVSAQIVFTQEKVYAEGQLQSIDGHRTMKVVVDRSGAQGSRSITLDATLEDGSTATKLMNSTPPERGTLFMDDLKQFVDTMLGNRPSTLDMSLKAIELAESLTQMAKANPESVNYK